MALTDVRRKLWTRDTYYQVASSGAFEGERVELIEGEVIYLSPQPGTRPLAAPRLSLSFPGHPQSGQYCPALCARPRDRCGQPFRQSLKRRYPR